MHEHGHRDGRVHLRPARDDVTLLRGSGVLDGEIREGAGSATWTRDARCVMLDDVFPHTKS